MKNIGRKEFTAIFAKDLKQNERFKTSSGFAVYVCDSADIFNVIYHYENDPCKVSSSMSPYTLVFPLADEGDYIYHG